jgi:hypothetical protein
MSGLQIRCETALPGDGERPPDDIPGIGRRQIIPTPPVIPTTPNAPVAPIMPTPITIQPIQPPVIPPAEPSKQFAKLQKK